MTKKQYAQAERDLRLLARDWHGEALWYRTREARKMVGGAHVANRIAMLYEIAAAEVEWILNTPEEP